MFTLFDNGESPQQNPRQNNTGMISPPSTQQGSVNERVLANGGTQYLCSITGDITENDNFFYIISILNKANTTDNIVLNICSGGGCVEAGLNLIHAMYNTKAKVTTYAMGITASIAAIIWACGHKRLVSPVATLMFHMPSSGHFGKTQDIADETISMCTYFTNLLTLVTKGILSEKEIDDIVNHRKDVYIHDISLNKKLNKLQGE